LRSNGATPFLYAFHIIRPVFPKVKMVCTLAIGKELGYNARKGSDEA